MSNRKQLPDMFVERREVNNTHWLHEPIRPWDELYNEQLNSYMLLMEWAKVEWWTEEVITELTRYLPDSLKEYWARIPEIVDHFAVNRYMFTGWKDIVNFVRDDECVEYMVILKKRITKEWIKEKDSQWFIDWNGTGHFERYMDRLNRKGESVWCLEKAFDAKWTFRMERPIIELSKRVGIDMTPIMPYMHPWHWAFPAGHGAKFFAAIKYIIDHYVLTAEQRAFLIVFAYVCSMARTWGWVHLPQDNYASAYLAGIKEFNFMWA